MKDEASSIWFGLHALLHVMFVVLSNFHVHMFMLKFMCM